MNLLQKIIFNSVIFAVSTCAIASGQSANSVALENSDLWQFELTPYLWTAGLSGDLKIGRLPTETINANASQLLSALNFGLMGILEAHKDWFSLVADAAYIDLSKNLPSPTYINADLKEIQQLYELTGMYRTIDKDKFNLDLGVGVRYLNLDTTLSVDLTPQSTLLVSRTINSNIGWTDGFIDTRIQYNLTNTWKLIGYADVGTGGSRVSWQAMAGVNYIFSKNFIGKIGYRILSEDYDKDKLHYNMRMGGFYLGLGIAF